MDIYAIKYWKCTFLNSEDYVGIRYKLVRAGSILIWRASYHDRLVERDYFNLGRSDIPYEEHPGELDFEEPHLLLPTIRF